MEHTAQTVQFWVTGIISGAIQHHNDISLYIKWQGDIQFGQHDPSKIRIYRFHDVHEQTVMLTVL